MPQYTSRSIQETFFSTMYCGSCTAADIYLKVASPQYMSRSTRGRKNYLVYCGTSCTAAPAVGVNVPQFESFYTVPVLRQGLIMPDILFASKKCLSLADAKSTPSYSSGLHFLEFQDRSTKGALICSKI